MTQHLNIPNPDYVVTLDADSVLLPEYCLRLVHLLEQSEYRDMAIAQTPYSAFPGSATRLERIAGATTDLQHIVHQGLTYYDATFWVGANAVIRKRALDDIVETSHIGDWEIRHYIKDRTVIEDTESTIDLGTHGWRLYNCPERMSYSATPPDFGSLCIQRRRWANGGLLILPKLRRQSRARRALGQRTRFGELFLRWNYMASISWSSVSLLVLLAFPIRATLISPLLGRSRCPTSWPCPATYRHCGYKRLDVLRVYGLSLILLPVNLSGTVSSIVQGLTASKAPFARTPKVRNRTVVPPFFVVAPYLLILLAGFSCYLAYRQHRIGDMAYAAFNVVLTCYAIKAFIGLRNTVVDTWIHGISLLYKQPRRRRRLSRKARAAQQAPPPTDWRSVLEVGFIEPAPRLVRGKAPEPAPTPPDEPRRRLSLLRVLAALLVLAGTGYGGLIGVQTWLARYTVVHQTWFAPYVDVTLTPSYQFQSSLADTARQTVLGYVVASSASRCTPSWGAAYTLARANQSLALGSRIEQLQQDGEQAIVSIGGQANTSLDVACGSVPALTAAYQSVIDAYQLTSIDLDVEGAALDSFPAGQRRAGDREPRAGGQRGAPPAQRVANPPGRAERPAGQRPVRHRLDAARPGLRHRHQHPDHGFRPAPCRGEQHAAIGAGRPAGHPRAAGRPVPPVRHPAALRADLAAARGHGDDRPERYPGRELHHGRRPGPGPLRRGKPSRPDLHCVAQPGPPVRLLIPEDGMLSDTCSGTAQSSLEFSQIFGQLPGVSTVTASAGNAQPAAANTYPADAPYPQWSATGAYPSGYKIVEDGQIYESKWYNSGDDPQAQVQYPWQTPWELLGPVLPGDHAPVIAKLSRGTYPAWSISAEYKAGDKVLYQGLPYEAKWANRGCPRQCQDEQSVRIAVAAAVQGPGRTRSFADRHPERTRGFANCHPERTPSFADRRVDTIARHLAPAADRAS